MIDREEFECMIGESGAEIRNKEKAYRAYLKLQDTIDNHPEEIGNLINSCYKERAQHRNTLADMLIETTPQEIDELIELIKLIKENEQD
jgi:hypothetical protein